MKKCLETIINDVITLLEYLLQHGKSQWKKTFLCKIKLTLLGHFCHQYWLVA